LEWRKIVNLLKKILFGDEKKATVAATHDRALPEQTAVPFLSEEAKKKQMLLGYAVTAGDDNSVRDLLANGADVNGPTINYKGELAEPPLCLIANEEEKETLSMVKLLLEVGANVNACKKDGTTPLHLFCLYGKISEVKLLLEAKVNTAVLTNSGKTPLHWAIGRCSSVYEKQRQQNLEIVNLLLESGANANAANIDGQTPLHEAAGGGAIEAVTLLLKAGANVNAVDKKGRTPLRIAYEYEKIGVVKQLAEAGSSSAKQKEDQLLQLLIASMLGHIDRVQRLLDSGVNVNEADDEKRTALHNAAGWLQGHVIRVLLNAHAEVNARDRYANTPLHCASKSLENPEEVGRLLIEAGSDVNAVNQGGYTPLHAAAEGGHAGLVKLLLKAKADVNLASLEIGVTPLHAATERKHINIINLLLEAGANVNAYQNRIGTPLHIAAYAGDASIVTLLLRAGADVKAPNPVGATPIDVAFESGHGEIVSLLKAGAGNTDEDVRVIIKLLDENTNAWLKTVYLLLVSHVKTHGAAPVFYEDIGPRVFGIDYGSDRTKRDALIGAMRAIAQIDITAGRPPLALIAVSDSVSCIPDLSVMGVVESSGINKSAFEVMPQIARFWRNRRPVFD
jgi:ankyrin repeat protein